LVGREFFSLVETFLREWGFSTSERKPGAPDMSEKGKKKREREKKGYFGL